MTSKTLYGYISNEPETYLDSKGRVHYLNNNKTYLDGKGRQHYYNDKNVDNRSLFDKIKQNAQAFVWNAERRINRPTEDEAKQDSSTILTLATAPFGLGPKATTAIAKPLVKHAGKKIANMTAQVTGGGLVGGGIEGVAYGLENDKNPILTGLSGAGIGAVTGALGGYGLGKIGKRFAERALKVGKLRPEQYGNDYIEGLSNVRPFHIEDVVTEQGELPYKYVTPFEKELAKFKALRDDYDYQKQNPKVLFDTVPEDEFLTWFKDSKMVDDTGKPLLFRDDDNVFITDGYSNNGISKYTYKGGHRAPSNTADYGTIQERIDNSFDMNLNEVLQGFSPQPDDYFSAMGPRWYGYNDAEGLESLNAIRKVKNGANEITAYRAVPNDVNTEVLNNGDWITFSRKYADMHGNNALQGNYKVIEQKVSPNDVWWDGNDIREWGYDNGLPQNPDILLQIRNPYKQEILPNDWMEARAIRNQGYDGIITNDGKYLVFEKDQIKRTSDIENYESLFDKLIKPRQKRTNK